MKLRRLRRIVARSSPSRRRVLAGLAAVLATFFCLPAAGPAFAQTLSTSPNRLPPQLFDFSPQPSRNVGTSVAIDGATAVIGAPGAGQPATNAGSVSVFVRSETTWSLQTTLTSPDPAAGDAFGASVGISGDTIIVGAPGDDEQALQNVGSAYIFTRTGNVWTFLVKLHMPSAHGNDDFGRAVAISGNTAIVGAPMWDPAFPPNGPTRVDQGEAFVYTRSGTTWLPAPQLLGTAAGQSGDAFGYSVSVDGDVLAVGAPGVDGDGSAERGAVRIFRRGPTAWVLDGTLTPTDSTGSDLFGASTAVRGDLAIVGAPRHDANGVIDQGAAYVFRKGSVWALEAKLIGRDGRANDQAGTSVALSASYVGVGAPFSARVHPNGPGQLLLFQKAGTLWNQIETLLGDTDQDQFGRAIAIGADYLASGAPTFTNNFAAFAGVAYYFPLELLRWRFEAILPGTFISAGGIGRDGLHTEAAVVDGACCMLYGIDRVGQGRPSSPIVTPRGPTNGSPGDPTFLSDSPVASTDGRYVAFTSLLPNLVVGDTNSTTDIFVKDRVAGAFTRVSEGVAGQANAGSFTPSISADGQFVAFASAASNLVTGDTNGAVDIFVRDRTAGTTTRVSVSSGGVQGNGASTAPSISGDGRFVAFVSEANNLVVGDTNGQPDIFIYDRDQHVTTRASGSNANGPSRAPAISGDGQYTVFESDAGNIAGGDGNGFTDIFLFNYVTGSVTRMSVATSGALADGPSQSPAISPDGRYIAFSSVATNLSVGDTNGIYDIFVRDLQAGLTGATSAVGRPTLPGITPLDAVAPAISDDGQTISFLMHPYLIVRSARPLIGSTAPVSVLGGPSAINGSSFTEQLSAWVETGAAGSVFGSPAVVTVTVPPRPAGPAAVSVGLTADTGWHGTFVPSGLVYFGNPPTVTAVNPSSGPIGGGTVVSITGSGFVAGLTTVTFGGVAATGITVGDSSHLTAIAPPGAAGSVNVVVTTAAGQGTLAGGYLYFRLFTLTVVRAGTFFGTVTSVPAGIDCGSDCGELIREGTQVTLTAAPEGSFALATWSAAGCASVPVCTFTMSGDLTVTATYGQLLQLSVTVSGPGKVTSAFGGIDCPGTTCFALFPIGAVIPLTATPNANAHFVGWGTGCPAGPVCNFAFGLGSQGVLAVFALNPPAISSVTPSTGSTRGGTLVTLRGTFVTPAANVSIGTIGEADGLDVTVLDSTTLTFRTPPLSAGVKDITVRNSDGQTVTKTGAFTALTSPARNPDLDHSGEVDVYDATRLTACLGVVPTIGTACWDADLDDSGAVDSADLDVLKAAYGQSALSTQTGAMTPRGASASMFNPVGATVWFDAVGDTLDLAAGVVVFRNGVPLARDRVQVTSTSIRIDNALLDGRNRFEVVAWGVANTDFLLETTFWAGTKRLDGNLQGETPPVVGGTVTATVRDAVEEFSWTIALNAFGSFTFPNVPDRSISLTIRTANNRIVATGVRGDAGIVLLQAPPPVPPSSVKNLDFAQGLAGWSGDAVMRLVPHVENAGTSLRVNAALDSDLEARTSGAGPRHTYHSFVTEPGVSSVSVRFRFQTDEFPLFFNTKFDDQYSIVLTTAKSQAFYIQNQSMNGLGFVAFNADGETIWREVTIPVDPSGDTVQLAVTVANVGDGIIDSSLIIDKVTERHLRIEDVELLDTDNQPLNFISVTPHEYFSDHATHIHGRLNILGRPEDKITEILLEIIRNGSKVSVARLTKDAVDQLKEPFGSDGRITIGGKRLLFTLGGADLAPENLQEDTDLELQLSVTTALEGTIKMHVGRVGAVVRVTGINRFGSRTQFDLEMGGDDWAQPSLRQFAFDLSPHNLTFNDFSNMNAGSYEDDHHWHQRGLDVDARWPLWVNAMDPVQGCYGTKADAEYAADRMLELLRDPIAGPKIRIIFITCKDPANHFWEYLKDQTVNGQPAATFIRYAKNHHDHIHIRILEEDGK